MTTLRGAESLPSLRPSLRDGIAQRAGGFVGRDWVLKLIEDWADRGRDRFLILAAEPGFGKTALAAWIAGAGPVPDDLTAWARLDGVRSRWGAVHFCVGRTQMSTVEAGNFPLELARQLQRAYPEYDAAILRREGVSISATVNVQTVENGNVTGVRIGNLIIPVEDPQRVYDRAVRRPLTALCEEYPGLRVFILVDALDEALADNRPTIVDLIAGSEDFPTGVRFLLTCRRNDARVLDHFPGARVEDLSDPAVADQNDQDIRAYIENHPAWQSWCASPGSDPSTPLAQLLRAADGNFLYLRFLLDEVEVGTRSFDRLGGLPSGLSGLYRTYLDRLIPDRGRVSGARRWLKECEPLLGLLCVAEPAAPDTVLPQWLGWTRAKLTAHLLEVRQVTEYVRDDGGGHRLYHRSMVEFLTSSDPRDPNPYYVEPGSHHWHLGSHYRKQFSRDWSACDHYGLRRLVLHLKQAAEAADLPAERRERSRAMYEVVLDSKFRASQIESLGDSTATLADLRLALEQSLADGDVVVALECIRGHFETVRGSAVSQGLFAAASRRDYSTALRRAEHYGTASSWNRVLHSYLAWQAAGDGDRESAERAAELSRPQAVRYDEQHFDILCSALLWQAAMALGADGIGAEEVFDRLAPSSRWVLDRLRVPAARPDEVPEALANLRRVLTPHDPAVYEREAASVDRDFADAEVMARVAWELRDALLRLAPYPEGRAEIEKSLEVVVGNPYPFYRDVALSALATVGVMSSESDWAANLLRRVLQVAFDREGAVFTFDVPTLFSADAPARAPGARAIRSRLEAAAEDQGPWGTRIRALSGRAALAFTRGDRANAFADLEAAAEIHHGFAGFSVLHFLALASRWVEFGESARARTVVDRAATIAPQIQNFQLRTEREHLVRDYRGWLDEPATRFDSVSTRAGTMVDLAIRMAYIDLVSARWVSEGGQDQGRSVAALVPLALADRTTLDTVLGRFLRLGPSQWSATQWGVILRWCQDWLEAPHRGGRGTRRTAAARPKRGRR